MKNKVFSGKAKRLRPPKHLHKHPVMVPVVTFSLLTIITATALYFNRQKVLVPSGSHTIILSHDKRRQTLPTRANTVGEFLDNSGIRLAEGDIVEPDENTSIVQNNFKINVYRAKPVAIIDNGRKIYAMSAATTPRSIAKQAGLEIYPEDLVSARPTENFLRDGTLAEQVSIERAIPININLYGTPVPTRTHAKTVSELLKEKNLSIGQGDEVQPVADTKLTPNAQVFLIRKGTKITSEEQAIAMPVETIDDPSLTPGTVAVRQKGSPGKKVVTYQIELKNNQEVSRRAIQEVIQIQPVKHILVRGPLGSFGNALARLRQCESGGNYANKSNPTYRGAYQYDYSTWANYSGIYDPADAPPAVQDQKATETYQRRGWQPWPSCSSKLGLQDIYR